MDGLIALSEELDRPVYPRREKSIIETVSHYPLSRSVRKLSLVDFSACFQTADFHAMSTRLDFQTISENTMPEILHFPSDSPFSILPPVTGKQVKMKKSNPSPPV